MQDFGHVISTWQPFFITLASLCATLAGLLFVAVSLHPGRAHEQGRQHLRNLAQHTFGDFLQVLFVGIFYSVPAEDATFYAVATLLIVGTGMRELVLRLVQAWRGAKDEPHRVYFLRRVGLSLLGRAFLLLAGVMFLFGPGDHEQLWNDMMYIFSGCLVLLISGLRNAWFLMQQELG